MSLASFSGGHVEGAYDICTYAFCNRAVSRPLALPASSCQSSRDQLVVLALFWELDSRGASSRPIVPPSASGSACVSIWSRLTGVVLILRRVCVRTIQTSSSAALSPWIPLDSEIMFFQGQAKSDLTSNASRPA